MRRLVLILAVLAGLLMAGQAAAHPLGNFTVNTSTRVELSGGALYVRHALDMAEIPTFREAAAIRAAGGPQGWADARAPRLADAIVVTAGGRRLRLEPVSQTAALAPGEGGLQTLRLDAWFRAPDAGAAGGTVDLVVRDRTAEGRPGFHVVTAASSGGARIEGEAPPPDPTDGLRDYPPDLPAGETAAPPLQLRWVPGEGPGPVAALIGDPGVRDVVAGGGDDRIGRLVSGEAGIGAALIALLAAVAWGAAHALSPGHGKSMVAAYLVGSRGTTRHALLLGLFVTVTHTVGVVALGLVTLWLSQYILPEDLFPWLNLVAALLVVGVGGAVLRSRLRSVRARRGAPARVSGTAPLAHRRVRLDARSRVGLRAPALVGAPGHHHHGHHHHHGDDHGHDHGPGGHTHTPPEDLGMRNLLAVGAAAGIVPCPSALVLMLGAISLDRVGWGLVLVLAFSAGLAGLLSVIGIMVVHARRLIDRVPLDGRLAAAVPVGSALVILALGAVLTLRAIPPLV